MPNRKLSSSWVTAYSEAVATISEAPSQYNIWSAISVVSSVLKNRVYIKHGVYTIYPNQYVVLVGPPGIGKGTAIHPAFEFPKDLNLINTISDRVTAPRIIERLASGTPSQLTMVNGAISVGKDSSAILMSTELPTLVTSSDWMLQFLCDAWDRGDFYYDTKNSGHATVKGMCVSLIGACVPEYIRRLNKDAVAAINGGFTARTIFVYANAKSQKIPWPKGMSESAKGKKLIVDLQDDLKQIATLSGPVGISPDARLEYEKFYSALEIKEDDSDVVMHFKGRLGVHVLKLAMTFCCAQRDDLIIDRTDMQVAIMCLKQILDNLDKAFRGVGESELAESTARVQNFIEKKGITTRNEILTNIHRHVTSENLDRILNVLCNINFCRSQTVGQRIQYVHVGKKFMASINLNMNGNGQP